MGLSSWIMFPCRLTVLGMSFFWTNPNVSYNGFNIYAIKLYYVHYLTTGFITGYVRWWVVCTQDTGVLLVWIPATVWEGTSQLKLWCWIVVAATLDVDVFCFSDWLKGWTGRSLLLLHLGLSENGIPPDSHDYHYFLFFSTIQSPSKWVSPRLFERTQPRLSRQRHVSDLVQPGLRRRRKWRRWSSGDCSCLI